MIRAIRFSTLRSRNRCSKRRFTEPNEESEILLQPPMEVTPVEEEEQLFPLVEQPSVNEGTYFIDLANALGLGGADNLQVRLARTKLFQAQARHLQAKTLWLPSLRFGVGYNKHDGTPSRKTEGNVIEVERNSFILRWRSGAWRCAACWRRRGAATIVCELVARRCLVQAARSLSGCCRAWSRRTSCHQ